MGKKLEEYFPDFVEALKTQLDKDEERWGNTWKGETRSGQDVRIFRRFTEYYVSREPMPWLKIAGNAFIAWVRENYPDWKDEVK